MLSAAEGFPSTEAVVLKIARVTGAAAYPGNSPYTFLPPNNARFTIVDTLDATSLLIANRTFLPWRTSEVLMILRGIKAWC